MELFQISGNDGCFFRKLHVRVKLSLNVSLSFLIWMFFSFPVSKIQLSHILLHFSISILAFHAASCLECYHNFFESLISHNFLKYLFYYSRYICSSTQFFEILACYFSQLSLTFLLPFDIVSSAISSTSLSYCQSLSASRLHQQIQQLLHWHFCFQLLFKLVFSHCFLVEWIMKMK